MFHDGDLNSAISLAIQKQKLVACFVRSDNDEWSGVWEDEWLAQPTQGWKLGDLLSEKAVLLKIEHGSQEANFLGAFCTIEKTPSLIVIHNGQVLEQLEGGISLNDFMSRVLKVIGVDEHASIGTAEPVTSVEATLGEQEREPAALDVPEQAATTAEQASEHADVHTLFPDRAQRLEADKAKREAAEKAERKARQEARRKEAEDDSAANKGDKGKQKAATEDSERQNARQQWIYQQRQRNEEAKRERERIRAQIEADKAERRARAAETKARAESEGAGASESLSVERQASNRRTAGAGGMCSLQVRLFDGTSIRSRFPAGSTLDKSVREWIRQELSSSDGTPDVPYTFRHILAPRPSRSIEVSEEHQTLAELGLAPSATLVLVPVAEYTEAYSSSSTSGLLGRGWNMATWMYDHLPSVSYLLPSFSRQNLETTQADARSTGSAAEAEVVEADPPKTPASQSTAGAEKIRVKTLADQRAEAARKSEAEFYNGNSLGFAGRKDDDPDAKKK